MSPPAGRHLVGPALGRVVGTNGEANGVHPVSAGTDPNWSAELRTPASWGHGKRGAAGYDDAGGSELVMRDGRRLGGLTAAPSGEPTIDMHGGGQRSEDADDTNSL